MTPQVILVSIFARWCCVGMTENWLHARQGLSCLSASPTGPGERPQEDHPTNLHSACSSPWCSNVLYVILNPRDQWVRGKKRTYIGTFENGFTTFFQIAPSTLDSQLYISSKPECRFQRNTQKKTFAVLLLQLQKRFCHPCG